MSCCMCPFWAHYLWPPASPAELRACTPSPQSCLRMPTGSESAPVPFEVQCALGREQSGGPALCAQVARVQVAGAWTPVTLAAVESDCCDPGPPVRVRAQLPGSGSRVRATPLDRFPAA